MAISLIGKIFWGMFAALGIVEAINANKSGGSGCAVIALFLVLGLVILLAIPVMWAIVLFVF